MITRRHLQFFLCTGLFAATPSCSDGRLDAFTRQTQTAAGGSPAASGGAASGSGGIGNASGGAAGKGLGGGAGASSGPLLIDDLEDGDNQTLILGGWWYMHNDGSGSGQALYGAETNRAGSRTRAVRAQGSGYRAWFFIGVDLPGQPNLDASAFSRVTFQARAEPTSVVRTLSIDLLDSTSVNQQDFSALHFRSTIELGNEWATYSLPLNAFVPTEGDAALRVNRAELSTLEFWVFSPEPFDFWLDDLGFAP